MSCRTTGVLFQEVCSFRWSHLRKASPPRVSRSTTRAQKELLGILALLTEKWQRAFGVRQARRPSPVSPPSGCVTLAKSHYLLWVYMKWGCLQHGPCRAMRIKWDWTRKALSTVLATQKLFRYVNVDMMIISRVNPFLPGKLETTRFASLPAMYISESGAPPAGHSRIHHSAGCSRLLPWATWL